MWRLLLVLNVRLAHQRARALLSIVGIALGVALGFGVHLMNRAAVDELAAAVRALAGDADLEVLGGRSGFDESVYVAVARLPGVAVASPVLELQAGIAGAPAPSDARAARSIPASIRVIGIDVLRAALLQPELFASNPALRYALLEPDTTLLSQEAAQALGLGKGDTLVLVVGLRRVRLRVAGVTDSALRGIAALTDISTAQWRLDRLGNLNRIDLRLRPGENRAALQRSAAALLPPGVAVRAVRAVAEASAGPSRAYRVNLNVLALVALFTGGFLVFSAQALEVARRRGEHALLRVLGLERKGILRLVLAEAAAIGVLGSLLGIALGMLLATLAVRSFGADLGAGMFRGLAPQIEFPPLMALLYGLAGVAIALIGALLPALDAARHPPARALKAGDEQAMFASVARLWPGIGMLGLGAALSTLGPVGGVPLFGYLAIACLLIGSIALMPRAAQFAFALLPRRTDPVLTLALNQLRGAPGQAMVSLAAIVASFGLMAAMAIMVASFRDSVDRWLDDVLPADVYLRTTHAGETAYLEPAFEQQLRELPMIARAELLRSARVSLAPDRPEVSLLARDLPPGEMRRYPVVGRQYAPQPGDPPPVWISEAIADLYGYRVGEHIQLPLGGRERRFVVAGVWRDYARQLGALLVRRSDYIALTGDRRANDASLWLRAGATPAQAMAALRALPGGAELEIAVPSEIKRVSLRIFDRSFAVTYAIEAVAVLVGLFGLSTSLGSIVLARRREFGMLRHLGMTRGQIGRMLAAEGGLLATLGAAAGLTVGTAISLILIHVVNRQSFNWSMDLHLPTLTLTAFTGVLIALAALTAYLSGREAMGMGPVRAVKEDW
ncbi:MAG: FtsX-like permease family protein [Burkholderiales bacterium]